MKIFGKSAGEDTLHFIGIGGIGMSGLAEVLARAGFGVQGSDLGEPYTLETMQAAGVKVFKGHDAAHVEGATRVVVSTAVRADNVELVEAKKRGLPVVHRADVLGEIVKNYPTVAVSGTHGKTSTTGLIWAALRAAGVDVGVINGGVLNDLHTNAVLPKHKDGWLVVEADESDASFLKYKPTVAVITNIEPEHMDTYGTEEALMQAFVDWADGADEVVLCADDPNALLVAERTVADVMTYGFDDAADAYVTGAPVPQGMGMAFDAVLRGGTLEDVVVALPGRHYVANAMAALCVAQLLKFDVQKAAQGLETFQGIGRRFSALGRLNGRADGPMVIDDYGHHPTEIATTLEAAKGVFARGKVVAVIQPHRYTRLRDVMEEFAGCAKVADGVILLPVYAAGEGPIEGVSSDVLAAKMGAVVVADGAALKAALQGMALGKDDAVVCLGAGSISGIAKGLVHV